MIHDHTAIDQGGTDVERLRALHRHLYTDHLPEGKTPSGRPLTGQSLGVYITIHRDLHPKVATGEAPHPDATTWRRAQDAVRDQWARFDQAVASGLHGAPIVQINRKLVRLEAEAEKAWDDYQEALEAWNRWHR